MAKHKKRWIKAVSGALVICLMLSVCQLHGTCESVRENVVRLHILANSDSAEDQALKLKVRDAILEASADWQEIAATPEEALALAEKRLPELQAVAEQTVAAEGYDYPVKAQVCRMYFTTRQYDTVTLPAGQYDAVRVSIGEAEGQNWWCVMYPPLCVGAATDRKKATSLWSDNQKKLVQGGDRYVVKFKVVEWAQKIFSRFRRKK
ncbi:MAG: stage II sporulation protein R [Clostridia bacterium]|nr:stage II sporulation protein R [Clostridia bacterium]